jgi:hypothetical protein
MNPLEVVRQFGKPVNALINKIAKHAQVDQALCARYDETLDSWVHRLTKRAFGRGAFESVAGGPQ